MKVFYIPDHGLGELFYDPISHRGISFRKWGIAVFDMDTYPPRTQPDQEYDIPESSFSSFLDVVLNAATPEQNYTISDVHYQKIRRLLSNFPIIPSAILEHDQIKV